MNPETTDSASPVQPNAAPAQNNSINPEAQTVTPAPALSPSPTQPLVQPQPTIEAPDTSVAPAVTSASVQPTESTGAAQSAISPLPPVINTPTPAGVPTAGGMASPSKSRTGLIIGLVVAAVLVTIAAAVLYFFMFSPLAQSKKASNAFMNAATAGDSATLNELANSDNSADTKQFLDKVAESVKGDYSLNKGVVSDGKGYYLYNLTNETNKYARTTVEKVDGKWGVTGFVYSEKELSLIPGQAIEEKKETSNNSQESTDVCLVQSDFDEWYKADYGKTATEYGFKFHEPNTMFTANVHFSPDSLEYSGEFQEGFIENMAELAKSVEGKKYVIRLEGSVGTTLKSDLEFANQRAEKVKKALIGYGVPESRIEIGEPGSVADYGESQVNDSISKQTARNVVMFFDPTCDSSASTGTGR